MRAIFLYILPLLAPIEGECQGLLGMDSDDRQMQDNFGPWEGRLVGFELVGKGLAFDGGKVGGFGRADIDAAAGSAVRAKENFGRGNAGHVHEAQQFGLRQLGAGAGTGADGNVGLGGHAVVLHFQENLAID